MLERGIYTYRSSRDVSFTEICNTIWESNYIYISNAYGGMHTYYTSIGDSLGAQWLRLCLPMKVMQVSSLVREPNDKAEAML